MAIRTPRLEFEIAKKKPAVKFQPVFALRISDMLKLKVMRKEIIERLSQEYNLSPKTIAKYLEQFFSLKEILSLTKTMSLGNAINILLWRYREKVLNHDDLSKIHIKQIKNMTPQQQQEWKRKLSLSRTHEDRSESAKQWLDKLTPEQKTNKSLKAVVTQIRNISWVTRLPDQNLLSLLETERLLKIYLDRSFQEYWINTKSNLKTWPLRFYIRRSDYNDILQEFKLAIFEALKKWDKKRDLDVLIRDNIIYHLYTYFSREKKYRDLLANGLSIDVAENLNVWSESGRVSKRSNSKNY